VRSERGRFRTAPDAGTSRAITFVVGGDVGGQRYCRRPDRGYDIFDRMAEARPDFLVANGDMIYADGDCPAEGPDGPGGWENVPGDFPSIASPAVDWTDRSAVRDVYRRHWRYNRADRPTQRFLREVPMYAQWDDHEVINDFGAPWTHWYASQRDRAGFRNLVEEGRAAFFDWNPIARSRTEADRIYRSFSWGEDADLFLLDQRSYRSRNDVADTPENAKTLLGREQLDWIKRGLRDSQATWKVVSQDVPFSILTGSVANGRDGWAGGATDQGFEREALDLLRFLDAHDVDNLAFVVTDVHNAQTIRYGLDADGDGDQLVFHEFVSGPLSAVQVPPGELDPSLSPTRLYAEGNFLNFGHYRVREGEDGQVHFHAEVRGEDGSVRPGSVVDLAPR
jgi:alkaline phosphatase D